MVLEIDLIGMTFWRNPSSCMLSRFECAHMNWVKSINSAVGGCIILLRAIFWSSKTRIWCIVVVAPSTKSKLLMHVFNKRDYYIFV